jgi:hypothetical protein
MASAMLSRYDDTDTEDDGRSIAAATTASYSLIAATSSVDTSIAAWTQIGEATVVTATSQQRGGWEPFPVANDDESLVWAGTDDGTIYARKSPGRKKNSSSRRMMVTRTWGNDDDDEELPSTEVALAGNDYNISELKGSARKSKKKRRERRRSPLILRRFNSDSSDDEIQTNNDDGDNEGRDDDDDNDDAETTYTRRSWMPQAWYDHAEPQSAGNNEASKRKRCCRSPSSCHLSFTCHVVIVVIIILVVFLVLLLFFLFQKGIIAWP